MSRVRKFQFGFSRELSENALCEIYHKKGASWFLARDVSQEVSEFGSSNALKQWEYAGAIESRQFRERGRTLKQYRLTQDAMYFCMMRI